MEYEQIRGWKVNLEIPEEVRDALREGFIRTENTPRDARHWKADSEDPKATLFTFPGYAIRASTQIVEDFPDPFVFKPTYDSPGRSAGLLNCMQQQVRAREPWSLILGFYERANSPEPDEAFCANLLLEREVKSEAERFNSTPESIMRSLERLSQIPDWGDGIVQGLQYVVKQDPARSYVAHFRIDIPAGTASLEPFGFMKRGVNPYRPGATPIDKDGNSLSAPVSQGYNKAPFWG